MVMESIEALLFLLLLKKEWGPETQEWGFNATPRQCGKSKWLPNTITHCFSELPVKAPQMWSHIQS